MSFFTEFVPKYLGYLLQGAVVTLELSFCSMTAGILILDRLIRLGFLADFLSRTVLIGFLTGVGI